jgi:phosphate-selective porin OprO and OprP
MRTQLLWKRWLAGILFVGLAITGPGVSFAGSAPKSGNIDDRLRALEAEIEQLKRERAQQAEEPPVGESQVKNIVDEAFKKQKVLAGWQDGFFLQSPSGDFKLKLRGYTQADGRFFPFSSGDTGNDSFYLRRVRPILEGNVYKWFGFRIMPDFGQGNTVLQDAYLDVTYLPYASLRAGKFKEPYSLERLQSGSELLFIERSLAQNIAPNRDVGVQLYGDIIENGVFQYQLGIFDGLQDGGSTDDDRNSDKDFAGRLYAHPLRPLEIPAIANLGFGFAGTYGNRTDDNGAVNFRTAGRSSFYRYANNTVVGKGIQWRIAPQGYWFWGPFGFMGEYMKSESRIKGTVGTGDAAQTLTAKEDTDGWFVQASWVITDEDATYKMVTPINNFDPLNGRWGAFEIAARVSQVNIDDDAIDAKLATGTDGAWAYTAGLNWYLNKNFKFQLNYERTDFNEKVTFSGEKKNQEDVFLTRFQLAF